MIDLYAGLSASLDSRLALDRTQSDSRGTTIIATAHIPADTIIAKISKSSVLSRRTTSLEIVGLDGASPTLLLAVCVLHEFLLGQDSRWCEYLNTLPLLEEIPIAALWSEDSEATRWIRGTEVDRELVRMGISLVESPHHPPYYHHS